MDECSITSHQKILVWIRDDYMAQLFMVSSTMEKSLKHEKAFLDVDDAHDFVKIFLRWYEHGLPEIGHPYPAGVGALTNAICIELQKRDLNNPNKKHEFSALHILCGDQLLTRKSANHSLTVL